MTKKKVEETSGALRVPKPKKKLGLSVPKLFMPHEELIHSNVVPFEQNPAERIIEIPDENIIPFEVEEVGYPDSESLDSQKTIELDSQFVNNELSKEPILDSQTEILGKSKEIIIGYPNNLRLDSQLLFSGNPNDENLDSLIAKSENEIAKGGDVLDSQTSKKKNLDSQKNEEKGKWAKYDRSRNRKGIFLRTDDELTIKFKKFCLDHKIDFSQGTELAWTQFMDSLDSQRGKGLDSLIATNNLITSLSKTKPSIINLYLAYNSTFNPQTKWKTSDDKVGVIFNNADIRLVEIGIIQTHGELYQLTEKGKYIKKDSSKIINAFSYYKQKIEANLIYDDEQMIETMLKLHRGRWEKITSKTLDLSFLEVKK